MVSPGRVLVAGGVDEAGVVLSSVGVFDVRNGTWQQLPDMNEVSSDHQEKIPFMGRSPKISMLNLINIMIMKTKFKAGLVE